MLVAILALLMAPPTAVTIFVGPQARDGFVDADQGVQDSIADIQAALGKAKDLRVVTREAGADLKLYVVRRQMAVGPVGGVGAVANGTGTVVSVPSSNYRLETVLNVGSYERSFIAEANNATDWHGNWKGCARRIAKDVSIWLAANRERVLSKR